MCIRSRWCGRLSDDRLAHLFGIDVHGWKLGGDVDADAAFVGLIVVLQHDFVDDLAQRRRPLRIGARQQLDHVRHVVEDLLHMLRARSNAAQKILAVFIQLVGVIGDQQVTEAVDREDRRFQIVRQHGEELDQLLEGDLGLFRLFLIQDRDDGTFGVSHQSKRPA